VSGRCVDTPELWRAAPEDAATAGWLSPLGVDCRVLTVCCTGAVLSGRDADGCAGRGCIAPAESPLAELTFCPLVAGAAGCDVLAGVVPDTWTLTAGAPPVVETPAETAWVPALACAVTPPVPADALADAWTGPLDCTDALTVGLLGTLETFACVWAVTGPLTWAPTCVPVPDTFAVLLLETGPVTCVLTWAPVPVVFADVVAEIVPLWTATDVPPVPVVTPAETGPTCADTLVLGGDTLPPGSPAALATPPMACVKARAAHAAAITISPRRMSRIMMSGYPPILVTGPQ
jgi:hypothetical protein